MGNKKMFQVSTLQTLMLGYSRAVISVEELLTHGDTGLGTFANVDGEMILLDGICYRAMQNGDIKEAESERGVPFSVVSSMTEDFSTSENVSADFGLIDSMDRLKTVLNNKIIALSGRNSMCMARIEGEFERVLARSVSACENDHTDLNTILKKNQRVFAFEKIKGILVCVCFPDYMDGINAVGWHVHFISEDRKYGGHVLDVVMKSGKGIISKIDSLEIKLPDDPVFDAYSLKQVSEEEVKAAEQGSGVE